MPYEGKKENRAIMATHLVKHLKSRQHALFKSLIHLPSMAITLGVLTLTFRNIFWGPQSDTTNTVLNSLQFAAQLHTSLIVMSLSAMLLHVIHRGLSSGRGIPLGFLSSGFQLNSVSYMFRKEFTRLNIGYILIFLVMFILALLSGPSSAITMIPRLQFWNVQNSWVAQGHMDFHIYIQAGESSLYPDTLTADNAAPECFGLNASILSQCPAFGIRTWMQDDTLFAISDQVDQPPYINKTIQEGWVRSLVGQPGDVNQGVSSLYLASTLSTFLGNALTAYSTLMGSLQYGNLGILETIQQKDDFLGRYDLSLRSAGKRISTRKPVVEVQCTGWPTDATNMSLDHSEMVYPPWTSDPIFNTDWSISAADFATLAIDNNSTLVNSSWINIEQFGSLKPSLGAYFATPELVAKGCVFGQATCNYSQYTCTIDARWMPTRAILDGSSGKQIVADANPNPIGPAFDDLNNGPAPPSYPSVFISESWSQLLSVPWIDSITNPVPSNRTILDTIGQKCLDKNTFLNATLVGRHFDDGLSHRVVTNVMDMLGCLQVSLSVYLSDALARAQNNIPTYFVMKGEVFPPGRSASNNVYLVQDLYWGHVLPFDDGNLQGQFTNLTEADFNDWTRFTELAMMTTRYGYGYGFQDSKLIYVGTCVLLLHLALCVVYIAWILGTGECQGAGWETIGELIWMTMQSGAGDEKENPERNWEERFIVRQKVVDGSFTARAENKMVLRRAERVSEEEGS
jgi:hypothetical protein